MTRAASLRAVLVRIRLPHGSVVAYVPSNQAWLPSLESVAEAADLVPYHRLMSEVAGVPHPMARPGLTAVVERLGGRVLKWFPPDRASFPPPLPRPAAPQSGSLSVYLRKTPEARHAIRTALRGPAPHPPSTPLLCPPLGANPGLVGTAFDYALRVVVHGRNLHLRAVKSVSVARYAAFEMNRDRVLTAVDAAEHILQEVADGLPFGETHARAAVVLASYEVVARTGLFQDLAGVVPEAAWRDVLALVRAVPGGLFRASEQLILGPRFPAAGRFGGADADLLIDDVLVEIKATQHLKLDSTYLQQLVAYLVLERLAGIHGSAVRVRRLAVYYARHGVLQVMTVAELFRPGLLPQLVGWFDDSLPIVE